MAKYRRRDSFAVVSLEKLMSEDQFMLYKKEFYLLWYTGIRHEFIPDETVAVCTIAIDDGSTTVIRLFHASAQDDYRAEDKILEWLDNDPYINFSQRLDIEIIMNLSPLATFSRAFTNLIQLFADQEKEVNIEIKIVKVANSDIYDIESRENREGLIDLHEAGVKLSPVTGKDWTYLREVLRDTKGLVTQEKNGSNTRKELQFILSPAESRAVNTVKPEMEVLKTVAEGDGSSESSLDDL